MPIAVGGDVIAKGAGHKSDLIADIVHAHAEQAIAVVIAHFACAAFQ